MLHLSGLLICLCGLAADGEVRTWTKVQGGTIQAQFLREVDGEAVFLQNGKPLTIPIDQLIEQDQKLIRELEKDKKVEETPVPLGVPVRSAAPSATEESKSMADRSKDKRPSLVPPRLVPEMRTWHEIGGKQHTAKFTRIYDGTVVLTRAGDRITRVPFASFSREDQQYIRELLAARGEAHLCPPAANDNPASGFGSLVTTEPATAENTDAAPDLSGPTISRKTPLHELTRNRPAAPEIEGETPFAGNPSTAPRPASELEVAAIQPQPEATEKPAPPRLAWPELPKLTGRQIGAGICVLSFGLIVGSAIGSVILRAAISMFNVVAGVRKSRDAVPEPTYGEGMGIIFLTSIAHSVAGVVLGIVLGAGGIAIGAAEKDIKLLAQFVSAPFGILVVATMFSTLVPTTFLRAIVITIFYAIIWIFVLAVVLIGVFAIFAPFQRS